MKEQLTRHANFTRKAYASIIMFSALSLTGTVTLEAMDKVPNGTTEDLTKVAIIMIEKTRRMHLEAEAALRNTK